MKKVLVVDDDFQVRQTVQEMLKGVVDKVIVAPDAVNALIILKNNPDIEGIVTDYRLPGLSGNDWIEILLSYHKDLPLLVITGYEMVQDKLAEKNVKVLIKPFTQDQLLDALGI